MIKAARQSSSQRIGFVLYFFMKTSYVTAQVQRDAHHGGRCAELQKWMLPTTRAATMLNTATAINTPQKLDSVSGLIVWGYAAI